MTIFGRCQCISPYIAISPVAPAILTMAPAIFNRGTGIYDRGARFDELSSTVAITSAGLSAARTRLRAHLDPCDIGKFRGDLSYEGGRLINYGYNFLETVIFLLLNYNQSIILILIINY